MTKAQRTRRRRIRGVIGTLGAGMLALGVLAFVGLALLVAWYATDLPSLDEVTDYRPRQSLRVYTADGVEIAQFGSERRLFVPIGQMPQRLRDAVLAIEDTGFYDHFGISLRGVLRAAWANVSGGMPQGASTITQQVARTFFLSTRRTPERKIKEALLALQIESALSKDEIFELYLNQIYLGQRSYGFAAAAQAYYGKPLDELTLAETAMLAGLPQNPIHANPVSNAARAQRRQRLVLGRMLALGMIDAAESAQALAEPLQLRKPEDNVVQAQHVAEMARQMVVARFGERAYTEGIRVTTSLRSSDQQAAHAALRAALLAHDRRGPYRGPEGRAPLPPPDAPAPDVDRAVTDALQSQPDDDQLRLALVLEAGPGGVRAQLASGELVRLDAESLRWARRSLSAQAAPALALRRGALIRVVAADGGWTLSQWPAADGAFVSLDPHSGRVLALVGGFDFDRNQFNRAVGARRQPGSALKPFLVSAALEAGVMPETLVLDAPLTRSDGGLPDWNPQNSDGRFDGPLTLRQALARSKNLVSVRVLRQVGLPAARDWLARFGFDPQQQPDNLTLALGAGSTTPLELASAYAVFANGGWRVAPVVIERISGPRGERLFEAPAPAPRTADNRAIPARNAFVVGELLREVTQSGTAARARTLLGRPDLYGKTGTTNDAVDAWFAGYAGTPGLAPAPASGLASSVVAVAWIGHDEPRSLGSGESGGGLALPVWADALRPALKRLPRHTAPVPAGVVRGRADWRYAGWPDDGGVRAIDVEPQASLPSAAAAAVAATPRTVDR